MSTFTTTTNTKAPTTVKGAFSTVSRAVPNYFRDYLNSRQARFHAFIFRNSFLFFLFTVLTIDRFHLF